MCAVFSAALPQRTVAVSDRLTQGGGNSPTDYKSGRSDPDNPGDPGRNLNVLCDKTGFLRRCKPVSAKTFATGKTETDRRISAFCAECPQKQESVDGEFPKTAGRTGRVPALSRGCCGNETGRQGDPALVEKTAGTAPRITALPDGLGIFHAGQLSPA